MDSFERLVLVLDGQVVGDISVDVSVPLSLGEINQPVAVFSAVSLLKHSISHDSNCHCKQRV